MDNEKVKAGILIVGASIGWATGRRPKWVKQLGMAATAVGVGVLMWGLFAESPAVPSTQTATASTGGAASVGQSGGITAGTYSKTTVLPGVTPEELARRKKVREKLGKFIERLWLKDQAARFGWNAEERKKHNFENIIPEIQQYLKENLDESYATRFAYPEAKNLAPLDFNNRQTPYQGQAESESTREKIRFLTKVIEDLK